MAVPSAVIAGSRSFADALLAPLRLRLGAAPLVAGDPSALIASGTSAAGLVVLEYSGSAWLEAVRDVRVARGDRPMAIVAAVPAARSGDIPALRSAGVDETVPFDLRVDPVLWAVDRVLANLPRSTPVVRRVAAHGAAPHEAGADEVTEITMLVPDAAAPAVTPVVLDEARAGSADAPVEPSSLPAGVALEELLAAALPPRAMGAPAQGDAGPGDALQRAARRFTAQLTDLERAALAGQPLPAEAGPIRAAAALRFRVSAMLKHARAAGGALDEDAAGVLTAQVDEALAALKAASAGLPAEVQRAIGLSRNALVAEAIVLTEAMARLAAPGDLSGASLPAPLATPGAGAGAGASGAVPTGPAAARVQGPAGQAPARMLSNESAESAARAAAPRSRVLTALAVAILLVLGYHGWRLATRPDAAPPSSLPGAPANTYVVSRGDDHLVRALSGRKVDPAELERFKQAEAARGRVVRELSPGLWLVEAQRSRQPAAPPQAARP